MVKKTKKIEVTIICSICIIASVMFFSSVSASWLTGYNNRVLLFCMSNSQQTDYPLLININASTGVNQPDVIYCQGGLYDKTFFSDIRFTESDGVTLLDYWIESIENPGSSNANATVWVSIPLINILGDIEYYFYYGNPSATDNSNGENTFSYFMDFPGTYSNPTLPAGWQNGDDPYVANKWSVSNGVISFRGRGHINTIDRVWLNPATQTQTLRLKTMFPDPPFNNSEENSLSVGGLSKVDTDGNAWMVIVAKYKDKYNEHQVGSIGSNARGDTGVYNYDVLAFSQHWDGIWQVYEMERRTTSTTITNVYNDEEVSSNRIINDDLFLQIHGCKFGHANSPYVKVDWMLLRKTIYPEPQWISSATDESDLRFLSINDLTNNSITTEPITRFNWTKKYDTIVYQLQIANDSVFTDLLVNLSDINYTNYPDNYFDKGLYIEFILPETYIQEWERDYYMRVRAFYEV